MCEGWAHGFGKMLEILECRTRREIKRFFDAGRLFGNDPAEDGYLRRFANPALNPIAANGPMRFFLAREDERTAGRIMTFSDGRYIARTGRREGFFALADARNGRVANALFERAEDAQRKWGNMTLTGPVSPDGSGFFGGVSPGTNRSIFEGTASDCVFEALQNRGYDVISRFDAYAVCVPETNPFSALAARAEKRFCLNCVSFSGLGMREKSERWISDCANPERRADTLREYGRILSSVSRRHSFAVLRNGVCVGYVLTLGSKKTGFRVTTLETGPGAYTPPVALVLINALCDSLIDRGVKTVCASVVNRDNTASARLVKRVGGGVERTYREFSRKYLDNLTEK